MRKRPSKILSLVLAVALAAGLLPALAMPVAAADVYNPADVAAMKVIITAQGLGWGDDPAGWPVTTDAQINGVVWSDDTTKRLTGLTLSSAGLTGKLDVSGLTELTSLLVGNNQLTALDVSGNTKLDSLYVISNQLESLDVSKNIALTKLYCGRNQLTELNVDKNTALTDLDVTSNQLTEFDVSKNTALTVLGCNGNQLTELNVSSNTALLNLHVGSNRLTELDVSKNTVLTHLSCDINQLVSLDVSNTKMKRLYVNRNKLTSLNVSGTALEQLFCADNNLTSLDLSVNTDLSTVLCSGNSIQSLKLPGGKSLTILAATGGQGNVISCDATKAKVDLGLAAETWYTFKEWQVLTGAADIVDYQFALDGEVVIQPVFEGGPPAYLTATDPKPASNAPSEGMETPPQAVTITAPTTDEGWQQAAEQAANAPAGTQVTLDMAQAESAVVDGSLFEAAAGRDVVLIIDLGSGITWTVSGMDIPADTDFEALDLAVTAGEGFVPDDVLGMDGGLREVQLRLSHDGPLPFGLSLTIQLEAADAGRFANLFYYNPATQALEFQAATEIEEDGAAQLAFGHASDYLVVISQASMAPQTPWQNPFTDVAEADWFYGDVQYVTENGLFSGTGDTTFSPYVAMTRGMLVTVLGRMAGVDAEAYAVPSFDDTPAGAYYTPYVSWAAQSNLVAGYNAGTFGPEDYVTREQFALILYRYAGSPELEAGQLEFEDAEAVADWAWDAMVWATYSDIITGTTDGRLDPQGSATRAAAAAMLHRYLEK